MRCQWQSHSTLIGKGCWNPLFLIVLICRTIQRISNFENRKSKGDDSWEYFILCSCTSRCDWSLPAEWFGSLVVNCPLGVLGIPSGVYDADLFWGEPFVQDDVQNPETLNEPATGVIVSNVVKIIICSSILSVVGEEKYEWNSEILPWITFIICDLIIQWSDDESIDIRSLGCYRWVGCGVFLEVFQLRR